MTADAPPRSFTGLPWWLPAWLWRTILTKWFASLALGMAAYFLLSMINDITETIPLWVRLVTQVVTTLMLRLGFVLDQRRWPLDG